MRSEESVVAAHLSENHEWQAAVKDVTSVHMLHGRPPCPVCWHAANRERFIRVNKQAYNSSPAP